MGIRDSSNSNLAVFSTSSVTMSTSMTINGALTLTSTFEVGTTSTNRASISKIIRGRTYISNNINAGAELDIDVTVSGVVEGDVVIVVPETDAAPTYSNAKLIWCGWARNGDITIT